MLHCACASWCLCLSLMLILSWPDRDSKIAFFKMEELALLCGRYEKFLWMFRLLFPKILLNSFVPASWYHLAILYINLWAYVELVSAISTSSLSTGPLIATTRKQKFFIVQYWKTAENNKLWAAVRGYASTPVTLFIVLLFFPLIGCASSKIFATHLIGY